MVFAEFADRTLGVVIGADNGAHNNMLMGGRVHSRDRFSNWRLDIDDMSYEQLLELGDKIGYVNTGLKEDEISRCIRKTKGSMKNDIATNVPVHVDNKCSICQEEYEADEEMGKLCCGHSFHIPCIKQWLLQKNACPVCKTEAKTSMLASMDSSY